MPIEIAGITLSSIHRLATLERADFVRHRIPGLEGDIVQDMGRASVRIEIEGIYYGEEAKDRLEELRNLYTARDPVDFLADVVGEAYFSQVILEELEVTQQAREPEQFSYKLVVAEYVEPPEPELPATSLVDASILDDALAFADAIELPGLLSLPEFSNPLEPLSGLVDGASDALTPISANEDAFTTPNVFNQLDQNLANSSLDDALADQSQAFGSIDQASVALGGASSGEINQLIDGLGGQNIPEPLVPASYTNTLNGIQNELPSGSEDLLGSLTTQIGDLENQITGNIADVINPVKQSYTSANELISLTRRNVTEPPDSSPDTFSTRSMRTRSLGVPAEDDSDLVKNIREVITFLDSFGDVFNLENFLAALLGLLKRVPRGIVSLPRVPYVDELVQVLETALDWRTKSGVQIAQELQQTLQNGTAFVGQQLDQLFIPGAGGMEAFRQQVNIQQLDAHLRGLRQKMSELQDAIEQNQQADITTALTALQTLQNQAQPFLNTVRQEENFLNELPTHLDQLPEQLNDRIHVIISVLDPASDFANLGSSIQTFVDDAVNDGFISELSAPLTSLATDLSSLFDQLDLSVIEGPITTAATETQNFVNTVNGSFAQLVAEVSGIFDELEQLIDQVNVEELIEQLLQSIRNFQATLQQLIDQAFGPIRDAIVAGIQAFENAISDFSPEDIVEVLRTAIQSVTAVLSDPGIVGQMDQIKSILGGVKRTLDSLSFRTLNDLVIAQIDDATAKLNNIDTSELNDILKTALSTALALLPDEALFNSLRTELVQKFDELVTKGPIVLVENIREQPLSLVSTLEQYSPQNLLGDSLSAPFQQLVQTLESFSPVSLLEPVENQLEQIRNLLRTQANPALLIQPLEGPFETVLGVMDQLNPVALIAPVDDAISQLINKVLDALPLDDFFDLVDDVLGGIQSVIDGLDAGKCLIEKVNEKLGELANNPGAQVDNWVNQTLDKLDEIPPGTDLSADFANLQVAINQTKAASLLSRIIPVLDSFVQALSDLEPQAQLNDMILLRQRLATTSLDHLPPGLKTDIQNFISGFVPLRPAINQPLRQLKVLLDNIQDKSPQISQQMTDWDQQYHGPDAALTHLIPPDTSLEATKQLLRNAINETIKAPLNGALSLVPQLMGMLNDMLSPIDLLLTDLQTKIGVLVNGPTSLTAIRNSLEELVEIIRNINLDFLEEELGAVFNQVKGKVNALSPATLLGSLSSAFEDILANISLSSLIPESEMEAIDAAYQNAINTLKELDPSKLVIDVVQPEFEAAILPFLEPFDLTEIFDSLLDLLNRLKSELDAELDRTQKAFSAMLDAIPLESSSGVSGGVSI